MEPSWITEELGARPDRFAHWPSSPFSRQSRMDFYLTEESHDPPCFDVSLNSIAICVVDESARLIQEGTTVADAPSILR